MFHSSELLEIAAPTADDVKNARKLCDDAILRLAPGTPVLTGGLLSPDDPFGFLVGPGGGTVRKGTCRAMIQMGPLTVSANDLKAFAVRRAANHREARLVPPVDSRARFLRHDLAKRRELTLLVDCRDPLVVGDVEELRIFAEEARRPVHQMNDRVIHLRLVSVERCREGAAVLANAGGFHSSLEGRIKMARLLLSFRFPGTLDYVGKLCLLETAHVMAIRASLYHDGVDVYDRVGDRWMDETGREHDSSQPELTESGIECAGGRGRNVGCPARSMYPTRRIPTARFALMDYYPVWWRERTGRLLTATEIAVHAMAALPAVARFYGGQVALLEEDMHEVLGFVAAGLRIDGFILRVTVDKASGERSAVIRRARPVKGANVRGSGRGFPDGDNASSAARS